MLLLKSSPLLCTPVKVWITDSGIKVLNVAGSRQSGDPKIYGATVKLFESAFKNIVGYGWL